MSEPIDAHTLNARLARVIGKEVIENTCGPTNRTWQFWVEEHEGADDHEWGWFKWDPLHDANQMEEVEAVVAQTYNIELSTYTKNNWWTCRLLKAGLPEAITQIIIRSAPDKKRAFALAVYQMEQS